MGSRKKRTKENRKSKKKGKSVKCRQNKVNYPNRVHGGPNNRMSKGGGISFPAGEGEGYGKICAVQTLILF